MQKNIEFVWFFVRLVTTLSTKTKVFEKIVHGELEQWHGTPILSVQKSRIAYPRKFNEGPDLQIINCMSGLQFIMYKSGQFSRVGFG